MLFSALFLLAAGSTAPYPAADVLQAFSDVCQVQPSLDRSVSRAAQLGWKTYVPNGGSPMQREIEMIGAPLAGGGAAPQRVRTMSRKVSGRALELLLVQYDRTAPGFGCEVSDFTAVQPLSATMLARWASRNPLEQPTLPVSGREPTLGALPKLAEWKPGILKGSNRTLISFTPKDSIFKGGGMSGLMLASRWDMPKDPQ